MIGHKHPCMDNKSFFFDAIVQSVNHNVFIDWSGKNIDPSYNRKCNKVGPLPCYDFVFFTHGSKVFVTPREKGEFEFFEIRRVRRSWNWIGGESDDLW